MNTNEIARIASLVGMPVRTAMLLALMDGRAFTAHELARVGGVTPQTASGHLTQLVDAGLLTVIKQGRYRYHRLASQKVAAMLESIMQVAAIERPASSVILTGPKDKAMRKARLCYDHIGGRLGVAITDYLVEQRAIVLEQDSARITHRLQSALSPIDLTLNTASSTQSSHACQPCLDWSERRYHLAGPLGRQIGHHLIATGLLRHKEGQRALVVSSKGTLLLRRWLGASRWDAL